jgi:hypothetical protein
MRDWKKLNVPVLIFGALALMMLSSCQTQPLSASPEVLNEVAKEKDDTACRHFQTPLFTLDELRDQPPEALRILGLWDQLWVDWGCE